jgi:hypothetical protein
MPSDIQPVTLMVKGRRLVVHPPIIPNRRVGDKLRFDSKDGKFQVRFDRWIFSGKGPYITNRRARTIRRDGRYEIYCSLTTPTGERYAYTAGARGNVTP